MSSLGLSHWPPRHSKRKPKKKGLQAVDGNGKKVSSNGCGGRRRARARYEHWIRYLFHRCGWSRGVAVKIRLLGADALVTKRKRTRRIGLGSYDLGDAELLGGAVVFRLFVGKGKTEARLCGGRRGRDSCTRMERTRSWLSLRSVCKLRQVTKENKVGECKLATGSYCGQDGVWQNGGGSTAGWMAGRSHREVDKDSVRGGK